METRQPEVSYSVRSTHSEIHFHCSIWCPFIDPFRSFLPGRGKMILTSHVCTVRQGAGCFFGKQITWQDKSKTHFYQVGTKIERVEDVQALMHLVEIQAEKEAPQHIPKWVILSQRLVHVLARSDWIILFSVCANGWLGNYYQPWFWSDWGKFAHLNIASVYLVHLQLCSTSSSLSDVVVCPQLISRRTCAPWCATSSSWAPGKCSWPCCSPWRLTSRGEGHVVALSATPVSPRSFCRFNSSCGSCVRLLLLEKGSEDVDVLSRIFTETCAALTHPLG